MRDHSVYEIDVSASAEITRRDVDGWVPGQAPGNGKYAPAETLTYRIVARREAQARERALEFYRGSGIKDVVVVAVRVHKLDALVVEFD